MRHQEQKSQAGKILEREARDRSDSNATTGSLEPPTEDLEERIAPMLRTFRQS
jgi:hypothetical protein